MRVAELQEEQLAIHKQATAEAVANAKVTIESLIAEAEAARTKAMSEKGGAAAAVSALTAKAISILAASNPAVQVDCVASRCLSDASH